MSCRDRPSPLALVAEAGQRSLRGVLLGSLAIAIASAGLGLAVNRLSPRRIPLFPPAREDQQAALPLPPGLKSITAREAYAAFEDKSALFLDAQHAEAYARGHVPGALNLPPEEFDNRFLEVAEQVEAASRVIVYCPAIECGDAVQVAERLHELIPRPTHVMEEGWEAWRQAGYPVRQGDQP